MNGWQIAVEFLSNPFKPLRRLLRRQRILMDLRAVDFQVLKPYRLIEMLETGLEIGKQLGYRCRHFRPCFRE